MPRRVALSLFYCQLLCASGVYAQRSLTSFGPLTDLPLGYRPAGLAIHSARSARIEIAVLAAAEQPAIRLYEVSPAGSFSFAGSVRTASVFRSIVAAGLDRGKIPAYICIAASGTSISILKPGTDGALVETEIPVGASVQKCVVADLNKDNRPDLLLFGKNSAGVVTLLGQANGSFQHGPVLFPDISVSDLVTTDLNGDGITDVLALNWLSNQLTVFSGIGRMVYAEQLVVQLSAEPGELAVSQVGLRRDFRVGITFPEAQQIQVYLGNALGDYRPLSTFPTEGAPSGIQFAHTNSDDLPDIVTSTHRGIVVWLGTSATTYSQSAVFGIARSIPSWRIADVDRDGRNDCVLIDRTTQRLICLLNAENPLRQDSREYAVGASPMGLVIADFNGDGREDIGVVNALSSTFSLLLNNGKSGLLGQISFALPEKPSAVRRVASSLRAGQTVIASHAQDDKVSIMTFTDDLRQPHAFSVPSGSNPFVVSAKYWPDALRFLVRHHSGRGNGYTLSLFEQINPRQFVERSLRATLPTQVIALSVDDGAAEGGFELLFATNDKSTRQTTVWFGVSEAGFEFKTMRPMFSFMDSTASTQYVMGGFLNMDQTRDILVAVGPPRNELGIWYEKTTSTGADSIEWIRNIQPASDDAILLRDIDGDGIVDITLLDRVRNSVVTITGGERGKNKQLAVVAPADGVHAIRIATLREGGGLDLVMSNSDRGTVVVFRNAFNR